MMCRAMLSIASCLVVLASAGDSVCADEATCANAAVNSDTIDVMAEALWQEALEMGEDFHVKMLQKSALAKSKELAAQADDDTSIDDIEQTESTEVPYLWMPKMESQQKDFQTTDMSKNGPGRCQPTDTCWPTQADIDHFTQALEPNLKRSLHWKGGMNPRPAPVPLFQADQQPLYGHNENLKPVYVRAANLSGLLSAKVCPKPWSSDLCKMSVRNFPTEGWQPAFVVWPLKVAHVQETVNFAKRHNLCIAVVGAGHDFLNRHSCNNGVLLRTNLLKEIDFNPPNHPKGAAKCGPGLVFQEMVYAAQKEKVFFASGWANTVGLIGWSIGGGHGPYGGSVGLGSDNILEADMVLADGSAVTVNATHNTDLFWALRGGGGSTWGVITSLTVKAHPMPEGGMTQYDHMLGGSLCGEDEAQLNKTIDGYLEWLGNLDAKWSGLAYFAPLAPSKQGECPTWKLQLKFRYLGGPKDADFFAVKKSLAAAGRGAKVLSSTTLNFATVWEVSEPKPTDLMTNGIDPFQYTPNGPGLTPSVLLDAEALGSKALSQKLKDRMHSCKTPIGGQWLNCQSLQIYSDIPGTRTNELFPDGETSIQTPFRKANAHMVIMTDKIEAAESFYTLGSASYFGESAYVMDNWKERNFGASYPKLLSIKQKYDPDNVFWCRHCVGSD